MKINKSFTIGSKNYTLTNDHPASSYGLPVMLLAGEPHGWDDEIATDMGSVRAAGIAAAALGAGFLTRPEYNLFAGLPEHAIIRADVSTRNGPFFEPMQVAEYD